MLPRGTRIALATSATVAMIALTATRADATEPERVAILDLVLAGSAVPEVADRLEASLAAGLVAAGFAVIPRVEVQALLRAAPELDGCLTTSCLERAGRLVGARRFVRARAEAAGASWSLEVEVYGADAAGGLVDRVERSCPVCTIKEAADELAAAARSLREEESVPPDVREEVRPLPDKERPAPLPHSPDRRAGLWKWLAAGGGGLGLATGMALIFVDGSETDCPAERGTCAEVYDTLVGGVALTGVGLALGGVSAFLFTREARESAQIGFVPHAGGLELTFATRF